MKQIGRLGAHMRGAAWFIAQRTTARRLLLALFLLNCLLLVGMSLARWASPALPWIVLCLMLIHIPLPAWVFMEDGRRTSVAVLLVFLDLAFTKFVALAAMAPFIII